MRNGRPMLVLEWIAALIALGMGCGCAQIETSSRDSEDSFPESSSWSDNETASTSPESAATGEIDSLDSMSESGSETMPDTSSQTASSPQESDTDSSTQTGSDSPLTCTCSGQSWSESSYDELADNSPGWAGTIPLASGSVEPLAYRPGALLMRGRNGILFADAATASFDAISSIPQTGYRLDGNLDLEIGEARPLGLGLPGTDSFTLTMEGQIRFDFLEEYQFTVRVDDIAFVEIFDGAQWQRVVNAWLGDETPHAFKPPWTGWFPIRIAFVENTGPAYFELRWQSPNTALATVPASSLRVPMWGLQGMAISGFDDEGYGRPRGTSVDPLALNASWGECGTCYPSDLGLVDQNSFTVRWFGQIRIDVPGTYPFRYITDDGQRLWIEGNALLDAWDTSTHDNTAGGLALEPGWYDVIADLQEHKGSARAALFYGTGSPELEGQIVPVDRLRPTLRAMQIRSYGYAEPFTTIPDGGTVTLRIPLQAVAASGITGVEICVTAWEQLYNPGIDDYDYTMSDFELTLVHPSGVQDVFVPHGQGGALPWAGYTMCYGNRTVFNSLDARGYFDLVVKDFGDGANGTLATTWLAVQHAGSQSGLWDAVPTYYSQVFDAGGMADFGVITYEQTLPTGASIAVYARSAIDLVDLAETPWSPALASGNDIPCPVGRYFQYLVQFATSDANHGRFDGVQIQYCPCKAQSKSR